MKLIPKNWSSFQHYKHRSPPWIRLHRSLLDDFEFHRLPVASKALAPCLWLLASETKDGLLDTSVDEIAFRLRMDRVEVSKALEPLIKSGFFAADSSALAERKQNRSTETETETEERQSQSQSQSQSRASRLPADWSPTDDQIEFCKKQRKDLTPAEVADRFRDYWIAQPGAKGRKTDWDATWRNWVRNERQKPAAKRTGYVHDLSTMDYTKGVDADGNF